MKRNLITKAFLVCLTIAMLFSLASIYVSADNSEKKSIEWTMDEKATYLDGSGKRYERYYANGAFYGDARFSYYFKNGVMYDGRNCDVYGDSADPHIVSVKTESGYSTIFVDAEGKAILDNFLNGKDCIYYLESFGSEYTIIDASFVSMLDVAINNYNNTRTVDVTTLNAAEIYEITAHDRLEMKAYQHGAVYYMPDGVKLYINFRNLDNSYFDSDGYFSYRRGTVTALVLDDELTAKVNEKLESMQPKPTKSKYEQYEEYEMNGNDYLNRNRSSVPFWIFFSITGFVLPIPFLVIGLCKGLSKYG